MSASEAVATARAGTAQLQPDIGWELVRFTATRHARRSGAGQLDWARLAVIAADLSVLEDEEDPWHTQHRVMRLRGYLIGELGPVPGDPILGLEGMTEWFSEVVDDLDESSIPVPGLDDSASVLSYRRAKDAVRCFAPIIESDIAQPENLGAVVLWWPIRDQLP